jgi:hypothetical protein
MHIMANLLLCLESERGVRDMNRKRVTRILSSVAAAGVALLTGLPALGHHSYVMFDDKTTVDLEGTVKQWRFTKPHTWLILTVEVSGTSNDWAIEGPTTNGLQPRGWSQSTFKPGDRIKVEINPLRDGRKGGALIKATLADGTILTEPHSR